MRLLVTGAGGFVGGHLVDFLRAEHPGVAVHGVVLPHGGVSWRAAAGSLRSASTTRAPEAARHDTPPWGRTTPWISTPGSSACRKSTRCPPTKPPAPVTSSLTGGPRAPGSRSSPPR